MRKLLLSIMIILLMLSFAAVYAETSREIISSSVLRFHIIAASDNEKDEKIKMDVRDYVSKHIKYSQTVPYSKEYKEECEKLANIYLQENGIDYNAVASLEKVYIPRKSYKNIALPSGKYNAIRLVLGEGDGNNWWCVAYPPLCFTEEVCGVLSDDGKRALKNELPEDVYELISDETDYRFYIVDLIGKFGNIITE